MKLNILTIFPEYFSSPFAVSIIKRAILKKKIEINVIDIRKFAYDKQKTTDDRPFGGGPGMVMKIEPIYLALKHLNIKKEPSSKSRILLTSAKGKLFKQSLARKYSKLDQLTIICGHYEGVDERVAQNLVDDEIRVGDYVLTGGESASVVIVDAVVRLIPRVLGNDKSNKNESHSQAGKFSFPQYTRPQNYKGMKVPSVLLSGDHHKINNWRKNKIK